MYHANKYVRSMFSVKRSRSVAAHVSVFCEPIYGYAPGRHASWQYNRNDPRKPPSQILDCERSRICSGLGCAVRRCPEVEKLMLATTDHVNTH
jgi:hypothetical protein